MDLTFGSLFSGIGGIDLGLERAGWRCAWQVEIDAFCQKVLAKHWPFVPRFGDVRNIVQLPRVDLIAGGFPCQDLSVAGLGKGLESGERSGLWREFRRIVAAIGPRLVLVENVGRGWKRWVPSVRGDLGQLGYTSVPIRLRASDFGAPHERSRVFVLAADAQRDGVRKQPRRRRGATRSGSPELGHSGSKWEAPDADRLRELQSGGRVVEKWRRPSDCPWWTTEPDVARVVHGLSAGVDRRRSLGNAVVPQVAEWLGRLLLEAL